MIDHPEKLQPDDQHPLVTFALFAYNQEKYIREAVEGALAQTYSPLQIILSDDFSSDRTFEIMQEMVADYSGPHEILLNRNTPNLGVGGHVNRIMELACGDLIVAAAGDDISLAERTALLVNQWIKHGQPSALCSDCFVIDDAGSPVGLKNSWLQNFSGGLGLSKEVILAGFVKTQKPALLGCTEAWSRELFKEFYGLSKQVWFEDNALSLRAWLMNGIVFVPEQLVYYRQHSTNICHRKFVVNRTQDGFRKLENEKAAHAERWVSLLEGYKLDINRATNIGLIDEQLASRLESVIDEQLKLNQIIKAWWGKNFFRRLVWVISQPNEDAFSGFRAWAIPRLVPFEIFLVIRSMLSQIRGISRKIMKGKGFEEKTSTAGSTHG